MIFLSTFENKIDSKGRISVPAPFRATLEANQQPLIITRSLTDNCLQGQGSQRINQIVDILDTMDSLSPDVQILQTLLADAHDMKMDSEGRISLPEDMLAFAELNTTVLFAGMGRLFEIWNPEAYRDRAASQRAKAKAEGLPQLVLKPNAPPPSGSGGNRES
jgi:MraZ protein